MTAQHHPPLFFFPFIALPNGGKGTQTSLLAERLNMPRLDMGALLRAIAKEDSELGKRVQDRLSQGQLVSLDIVLDVLEDGVQKALKERQSSEEAVGFILDGFPRSLEQAEALMDLMKRLNGAIGSAIYLDVPIDVVRERAESRRVCGNCGAIYSMINKQPKVENTCDVCGHSPLTHRQDDKPEQVANRLDSFQKETQPVLDFFEQHGLLRNVDGNRDVETIYSDLASLIAPKLGKTLQNA